MMRWWQRFTRPALEAELHGRLEQWRAVCAINPRQSIDATRLIVVDVESSGLDPLSDQLLAIGAVEVVDRHIHVSNGFEQILTAHNVERSEAILIHGITPTATANGELPRKVLLDFLEYAGKAPLIAYHAEFDQAMLGRALRRELGVRMPNPWLDLAWLAPALFPEARLQRQPLDAWLDYFKLQPHRRHRALDDCLVTGELLLILLQRARSRDMHTLGELLTLAKVERERSESLSPGGV